MNKAMKIIVKLLPRNERQEVQATPGITVFELLQKLHLESVPVVVLQNNVSLPKDYVLHDDAELSILRVISGG